MKRDHKVMAQASHNLRDLADQWEMATVGLVNGTIVDG